MVSRREMLIATLGSLGIGNADTKSKKSPARTAPAPKAAAARVSAATRWMRTLTLPQRVAQLVFIPFSGSAPHRRTRQYRKFLHLVSKVRVGGLILVNWSNGRVVQRAEPYALAAFVNRMQRLSPVPLLVGGDFERGASMRVSGTTVFPHAMAFGAANDPALTRKQGEITAREARALGVHWVYYPVADVNNNPDNPIINIRSFGENPAAVAEQVRAFIEGAKGAKDARVLTTAKHFPGHGDTAVDTHLHLASVTGDRARLDAVELLPFREAIAAGVDSIMTAHLSVPALGVTDVPATLSPNILTKLLRDDLQFKGIVVTDALDMGGVVKSFSNGEAAVRALEAGADILLMPPDPEEAVNAVVAAVKSGRLSQKRVDESVARMLAAKERVGLHRSKLVVSSRIEDLVDAPESNAVAQEVADRAVTLVKNESSVVPLHNGGRAAYLLLAGSRSSVQGRIMADEIRKRAKDALILELDPKVEIDKVAAAAADKDVIVVAAFAQVGAYRSNAQLPGDYPQLMETLIASGKPVLMIALGNPYLFRHYAGVTAYMTTYSTVEPSEVAAVKAVFGEIDIRGRLPVSIPGLAKLGDGIQLLRGAGSGD